MGSSVPSYREAIILSMLVNGEKYGLEIYEKYKKVACKTIPFGSLYVTLDRMERYGFIISKMGESSHKRGGNRRKYFRITGLGERALKAYEIRFMDGILETT